MDRVEPPPLVGTQGAEDEMGGDTLQPKALAALVEQVVHLVDLKAEDIDELGATHGLPVELIGTREAGSGCASWHVAEGKNDDLQHPLNGGAAILRGTTALQTLCNNAAAAPEREDEMFDQLLRGPEPVILTRVHLAPVGGLAVEFGSPGVENLLQDGMHGMAVGTAYAFRGNYTTTRF
ncbi:MAG TPA: hypothetical protein VHE33_03950 [Acidobacteriaceae bacterium]|nr:hypothetical protein [Acidobacteriaceae bacterium]